jgi:hypothetical protein
MITDELLTIDNVWQKMTPELQDEVRHFWQTNEIYLPQDEAIRRSKEIVFIARNVEGSIIGVCSVRRIFIQRMNNYFYYYRAMIDFLHRRKRIAVRLTHETQDYFERQFIEGKDRSCIGLYTIYENQALNIGVRKVISPKTKFIFLGYNAQGKQMRVYYFKGAEI